MIRSFMSSFAAGVLLCASGALAQTKLQQTLSHVDLGIQGVGEFSGTVTGTPPSTAPSAALPSVTISPSNTVGALVTIRYARKPYVGAEFNFGYSRYTEDLNVAPGAIQTQADEFTLGYLVTPPYTVLGLRPYASAGIGGIRFAPTRGGGQGAPAVGRVGYYYNLGVQKDVIRDTFGIRAGFRQLFYIAPDFYQNYLTINQRTYTTEPMIGFYLRF